MALNLIWAQARNGIIGKKGALPWHLPEDMAHFKRSTLGCAVIMGRKTWDSLPAKFKPLPGRLNLVVTRQTGWQAAGAVTAHSVTQALDLCQPDADAGTASDKRDSGASQSPGWPDIWVIGGAEIYSQTLPLAHKAVVTEIDADFEGDAYAPQFGAEWTKTPGPRQVSSNGLVFSIAAYARR